jgi:uncharacterized protein (UPF0332 family)
MLAAERAFAAGDWETAVSRAYYAAYHSIVAVLEIRAQMHRSRWDHTQLQNEFRARFTNRGFLFSSRDARSLLDLYEARIDADYTDLPHRRREIEDLLAKARGLWARAKEVMNGS